MVGMMRWLRERYPAAYAACVFDAKGKTFRDDWYPQYKATRTPMPDDLVRQIEPIHEVVRLLGWPVLEVPGIEADDAIGTLARVAAAAGHRVIISTGDKDLAQLVDAAGDADQHDGQAARGARRRRRAGQVRRAARTHRRLPDADRRLGRQRARRRQGGPEDGRQVDCRLRLARRRGRGRRFDQGRGRRQPAQGARLAAARAAADHRGHRLRPVGPRDGLAGARCAGAARGRPARIARVLPALRLQAVAQGAGKRARRHRGRAGCRGVGSGADRGHRHGASRRAGAGPPLRHDRHARATRRLDRAPARRAAGRTRHRDRFARPAARAHRRHLVCGAAGRGGLRAGGAQLPRRARSARAGRGARRAEAVARGRGRGQGGAEHQVRRPRVRQPRHHGARLAPRHAAGELRARGAQAAQPGKPGRAAPRPQGPDLRRGLRQGRQPDRVLAGRHRARGALLRRGQRDGAAGAPDAVSATAEPARLAVGVRAHRDAGERRADAHGAPRRADRCRAAGAAEPRTRRAHGGAGARGARAGRATVQPGLAQADRRRAVHQARAAGQAQDRQRRAVHRRRRVAGAGRRLPAAGQDPRAPRAVAS